MLQSKSSFFASCFGRVTGVRREQLRGQTIGNLLAQGALRLRGEVQLIGELLLPPRVRPCIHSGNPRHAERQLRGADPLHKGQGAARGVDGHLTPGGREQGYDVSSGMPGGSPVLQVPSRPAQIRKPCG